MPSSLRELRQRRNSVSTTKKITRAMELIAASRIVKAQQRARQVAPYSKELTEAVSAVAARADVDHPLTRKANSPRRAAVLVITSDRGLAGAYSANVIKESDALIEKLRADGMEVDVYLCGRKAVSFYQFRNRDSVEQWQGFSESPTAAHAHEIGAKLIESFLTDTAVGGVDEIHVVFTRFVSMLVQQPTVIRMLPLEIVDADEDSAGVKAMPYKFEPDATTVLDQLLPLYVCHRIHFCLIQSAASELASRQRAMKSATDNAEALIEMLTREANQARQAEITQEISEIVGGAAALAETATESD